MSRKSNENLGVSARETWAQFCNIILEIITLSLKSVNVIEVFLHSTGLKLISCLNLGKVCFLIYAKWLEKEKNGIKHYTILIFSSWIEDPFVIRPIRSRWWEPGKLPQSPRRFVSPPQSARRVTSLTRTVQGSCHAPIHWVGRRVALLLSEQRIFSQQQLRSLCFEPEGRGKDIGYFI